MKRTKQSTFARRERSEKSTGFAPVGGEDMTHTTRHTPGPWFYNYDDYCIVNQAGVSVVNVHGAMGGYDTNADIALIAAAPAMYEALKLALAWSMDGTPDSELSPIELGMRQAVEAALAQAEGRQGR